MIVSILIYIAGHKHMPPQNAALVAGEQPKLARGDGRILFVRLAVLSITALALVSRDARAAANATMISAYYLGIVSGWLGRFYEPIGPAALWLLHGAIAASGALLVLMLRPWLMTRLLRTR